MIDNQQLRFYLRWGLGLLLALLAVFLLFKVAPDPSGCPKGTAYANTSLEEICSNGDGKVVCQLSSMELSPTRELATDLDHYSPTGPEGPWCKDAHNPPGGTP